MAKKLTPREKRLRRHLRVRKRVKGDLERPRLYVFRSLSHIYAGIVDDTKGHTLVSASTLDRQLRERLNGLNKTQQAALVGELIAQRALSKGIQCVVFDRGGYKYHGRVKALAEAARKGGLKF